MFKTISDSSILLATVLSLSWPLPAMSQTLSEGMLSQTPNQIADRLQKDRLQLGEIKDLLQGEAATAPRTDLWSSLGTQEGIPGGGPDPRDVIENAYRPVDLIERALQRRLDMPIGPRIEFMESEARRIVRVSGNNAHEMLMRYVLNRSLDVVSLVIPIYGRNTEEVARAISNFYRESFELAASFVHQGVGPRVGFELGAHYDSAEYVKQLNMGQFGSRYARLIWQYSNGLSSMSAKAVFLMRMTNYLGWDVNIDLRRRDPGPAKVIADVYELQQSPVYQRCVDAIAAGKEPGNSDVALLRLGVFRILQSLPERLGE